MEITLPDNSGNTVNAMRPVGWMIVVLLVGAIFGGCQRTPPVTFDLKIEAHSADPLRIEAVVYASDASAWKALDRLPEIEPRERILSLRIRTATNAASTALLGDYAVVGNKLRLRPRFPILSGETYEAIFDASPLDRRNANGPTNRLIANYRAPLSQRDSVPRLLAIYPSGDVLPANHLKFYLLFSEPMRTGEFLGYIKLLDGKDREVPESFRETELWSEDGRRLTLWFHPGRQKTGVNLNVEIGPVLQSELQYRLVISGKWPAQSGIPLGKAVEKPFTAGPSEHARLSLADWRMTPSRSATREPLRVDFPTPLDWALLQSQIQVACVRGAAVGGISKAVAGEYSWTFTPDEPWSEGNYELRIGSLLEDLAGNSLARPFEVNVENASAPDSPTTVILPFSIPPIRTKK